MRLLISTRPDVDGTVRLHVTGDIDLDNAYQIRDATDLSLTGGLPRRIIIELGSVSFIDSVGIGVLVSCFYAAAAYGLPLEVANPSPLVYRQLWVCGLAGLFGLPTHQCGTGFRERTGHRPNKRPGRVTPTQASTTE